MTVYENNTKCSSCGKYYLFMKLEKLNPYSDLLVCNRCKNQDFKNDKRRRLEL